MATTLAKPGCVLVLEDDHSVRSAYQRILTDAGYLSFAFDTFEKLKAHLAYSPALNDQTCLLLDMKMPGVTGLDVQHWLLEQKSRIAIIFVSGQSQIEEAISAMRSGAMDFLLKPVGEDQQIADALGITLRTVKMHWGNIMNKVQVSNVAQLVAMYQERRYART